MHGRTRLNQLHNLSACGMLLLPIVCSLEYGNEIWECTCNKGLADALESIILGC